MLTDFPRPADTTQGGAEVHERLNGGAHRQVLLGERLSQFETAPQLVMRRTDELHPWRGRPKLSRDVDAARKHLFEEPVIVASTGLILHGHEMWMAACARGQTELLCLQYSFTSDEDALLFLLHCELRRRRGLTPFTRIIISLEAEAVFSKLARERQRLAGQAKLSSGLTTGQPVDVRHELAQLAGVGDGQVTKAKHIVASAPDEILDALHEGEITIHRAPGWRSATRAKQRQLLEEFRNRRDLKHVVQTLVKKHQKITKLAPDLSLVRMLLNRGNSLFADVELGVDVIDIVGMRLLVSRQLYDALVSPKNNRG